MKPREAKERPAVIVDIDEQSLQKLGQWPWPRTRIVELITKLTKLGAAAISFDVVFAEQDRLSPALVADAFHDLDEETRNKLRSMPSNDQIMADVTPSFGCSSHPATASGTSRRSTCWKAARRDPLPARAWTIP